MSENPDQANLLGLRLKNQLAAGNLALCMTVRFARSVEVDERYRQAMREHHPKPLDTTADAVSLGAVQMAFNLRADLIVTFTASGTTALRVSRYRPSAPVLATTRAVKVEALKPWSTVATRYCSTALAVSAAGVAPVAIRR